MKEYERLEIKKKQLEEELKDDEKEENNYLKVIMFAISKWTMLLIDLRRN